MAGFILVNVREAALPAAFSSIILAAQKMIDPIKALQQWVYTFNFPSLFTSPVDKMAIA